MGILNARKKPNKNAKANDPFDLFEQTDPFSAWTEPLPEFAPSPIAIPPPPSTKNSRFSSHENFGPNTPNIKVRRLSRQAIVNVTLGLSIVALGFAVGIIKPWSYLREHELVYGYFEVRAVDIGGRPVAGAIVKNGGKKVGVTDSFGEWRRYMRVPLGSTISVEIIKKNGEEMLAATKNFAVPPEKPEKSDLELRGSVQLSGYLPDGSKAVPQQQTMASTSSEPSVMSAPGSAATPQTKEAAQPSVAPAVEAQKLEEKPTPAFVSNHESIWFEGDGPASSTINKEVIPGLIQRAKELGLKLDPKSDWKVRLTNLVDRPAGVSADGGGLMLVSSIENGSASGSREFLRNYQTDAGVTARGILFILSHHVTKNVLALREGSRWVAALPKGASELWRLAGGMSLAGESGVVLLSAEAFSNGQQDGFYLQHGTFSPCSQEAKTCILNTRSYAEVPPVPTWSKQHLKLAGFQKDKVKVFVSGYEARPTNDNVLEYWGQDRSRANLTVIQNGRVSHRAQIQNDSHGVAVVGQNAGTVSRR